MLISSADSTSAPVFEVHLVSAEWAPESESIARWAKAQGFAGRPGEVLTMPHDDGGQIWVGWDKNRPLWTLSVLPSMFSSGTFRLVDVPSEAEEHLALGWVLGHYRFDRYKASQRSDAKLVVSESVADRVLCLRDVMFRVRDLVNTPASDLGPAELAEAAQELAAQNGGRFSEVSGDELKREFPAIHAVGQASSRAPRLIRIEWGDPSNPPLAVVGKGVIFDSGGLSIKPTSGMVKMKKDMGGAAHALGLAELVMRFKLPVHLRVYIPAVENAIAGNAYRPSDIVTTRNGTTVEIGNTDAEGRVVLADALTLAAEEGAERIIDFATLTGAARVALGEDLPPLYARDGDQARAIQDQSFELEDPLWHMPLYRPYKQQIEPKIADLSNTGTTSFGGSLTAALFLDHFVPPEIDWMHLDIYAWNVGDRPGRPAGGEAQGLRALMDWLEATYRPLAAR